MKRRRGFSLIELLVVVAVGSVLTGTGIAVVYALLSAEQAGRELLRTRAALDRLADQFRRDAHAATALTRPAPEEDDDLRPAWQLRLDANLVVEYRQGRDELLRVEKRDGHIQRRESFALPSGTTASVESVAETRPAIILLRIGPREEGTDRSEGRMMRIEAAMGRDRRFLNSEGSKTNEPLRKP
jgi:prepilin-type N-terminal cleavage/methylation domain-containing protein